MNYPDKEHTLAMLGVWQKHFHDVNVLMFQLEKTIGLDTDAPMFSIVWGLFHAYTQSVASEVGDLGEWMLWYQAENKMGANGRQAGYDNKLKRIKTLAHLYELIAESHALELKDKE